MGKALTSRRLILGMSSLFSTASGESMLESMLPSHARNVGADTNFIGLTFFVFGCCYIICAVFFSQVATMTLLSVDTRSPFHFICICVKMYSYIILIQLFLRHSTNLHKTNRLGKKEIIHWYLYLWDTFYWRLFFVSLDLWHS